ncbi:mycofactocin-coupled SDR family oxidoreductase [Rhodococcus sp. IEGM 1408]|uniref:mycofactocin-coupled SDR family oxidoreductase n=1 Tax=Rhodococcus sp. IEGM 1408 TaxID=3082220 RepID=UPI0029549A93|nr:mycofactocin-coupled SDR family oxidoreductase [Rhodococcus sp. IEGM 1408]MDV7999929.1 mycofactocin-coupled SDR family oxidoreductase [Rhodococcus sp. IEGM 1408]
MGQEQSLAGKVAFITGAARGQGRSHAVELARRGARILALDICEQIETVPYGLGTSADLEQTVAEVREVGGEIIAVQGDVREPADIAAAVERCREAFGVPDIVVANAGINSQRGEEPDPHSAFVDTIMVNLVGVWNTVHAIAPLLIERGEGGSIVLISSTQGLNGRGGDGSGAATGYTASKHGVVGIMRSLMGWLAPHSIRINTIHPAGVPTAMVAHEEMMNWFANNPEGGNMGNALPVPMLDPIDISRAVLYLVEDSGRHVTGVTLPVDAGFTAK